MRSPLEVTIKRISPHAIRKYICIFGIKEVYWNKSKRYYAVVCIHNKIKVEILRTKDFFLACCARKSWGMKNVIGQ